MLVVTQPSVCRRIVSFLILILVLLISTPVFSHSPHDVVSSMALSPYFDKDKTIFIYVHDELKRSVNGGASWKNLERGLFNNELVTDIVAAESGTDSYQVFISTKGDGIYTSKDSGDNWSVANKGLTDKNIKVLAMSPSFATDSTIVALTKVGQVFVSTDSGTNWATLGENIKANAISLVSEKGNPKVLAAGADGQVYISNDELNAFTTHSNVSSGVKITTIAVSQVEDSVKVFYGTEMGDIYSSEGIGGDYTLLAKPASVKGDSAITSISTTYSANNKQLELYVSTWDEAVYISQDEGVTWSQIKEGLVKTGQADDHGEPHFYKVDIASGVREEDPSTVFVSGFAGVFKLDASKSRWIELESRPAGNVEGIAVAAMGSKEMIAIASYDAGTYVSLDSGEKWQTKNTGLRSPHLWDIVTTEIGDELHKIFAVSNMSFLTSTNETNHWHRNEIRASSVQKFLQNNFDEGSIISRLSRRVLDMPKFTFPTTIALSPDFLEDGRVFLGTRRGGLLYSDDSGEAFSTIWNADNGWISSLALSPEFSNDTTMASSVRRKGFFVSQDAGKTWVQSNKGLSEKAATYSGLGSSIIVFSPDFAETQKIYFGSADGVYVSRNGGEQWNRLVLTETPEVEHIKALALSPNFLIDKTIFVSVKGLGLFKSDTAGESFFEVAPELIEKQEVLREIHFSKNYKLNRTLFASSAEHVYVSNDRGQSWQVLDRHVRYENSKDNFSYSGKWGTRGNNNFSVLYVHESESDDAKVDFHFYGSALKWWGPKSRKYGEANIFIDGKPIGKASQFSENSVNSAEILSVSDLDLGWHVLTIENAELGKSIAIDAIDVY